MVDFPALWNVLLLGFDQLPGIATTLNGELGGGVLHVDLLHLLGCRCENFFITEFEGRFAHDTLGFGSAHKINDWPLSQSDVDALPIWCLGPEYQCVLRRLLGSGSFFPQRDAQARRVEAIEIEGLGRFG